MKVDSWPTIWGAGLVISAEGGHTAALWPATLPLGRHTTESCDGYLKPIGERWQRALHNNPKLETTD